MFIGMQMVSESSKLENRLITLHDVGERAVMQYGLTKEILKDELTDRHYLHDRRPVGGIMAMLRVPVQQRAEWQGATETRATPSPQTLRVVSSVATTRCRVGRCGRPARRVSHAYRTARDAGDAGRMQPTRTAPH
jgi:hypothetical protein